MIVVFLIVLIMALIIANMLIGLARPRHTEEKGIVDPYGDFAEVPEVIEKIDNLHENTSVIKGSLAATNQKLDLLNQRVSTLENVVMTVTAQKIGEQKIIHPLKGEKKSLPATAKKD